MCRGARVFSLDITSGSVDGIVFGKGEKTLVMLPGLRLSDIKGGAKAAAWYYRMFAREYTVYMLDRKHPVQAGCTIHDLAEDTAEAIEKLGLREVYLFGASQGGMIAQDLAIHHPDLVKKLVLAVTLSRVNDTVKGVIEQWLTLAEEQGLSAVAADYLQKGYSERYIRRYGRLLPLAVRWQRTMPVERFRILAKAALTCDTYDELDRIRCPVLVLGGGQDRVVTGAASREMAEKLRCPCHIYDELGHEAYNEAKDFNRRVYDFFGA